MKKILFCLFVFLLFVSIKPIYGLNTIEDRASLFLSYQDDLDDIIQQYEDIYSLHIVVISDNNNENINEEGYHCYQRNFNNNDGFVFSFNQKENEIIACVQTIGISSSIDERKSFQNRDDCLYYIQDILYQYHLDYHQLSSSHYLIDYALLLNENEYLSLDKKINEAVHQYNKDIVIYTTFFSEQELSSFSDLYYDSHGYQKDGYILVVDMSQHLWYVSTSGVVIDVFDDDVFDSISNVLSSLGHDNDYETFVDYLNLSTSYFDSSHNILYALLGAILISLLINYGRLSTLKTKRPVYDAHQYIKENSFHLVNRQDLYLYRTVTKRRKPEDHSSSHSHHSSHHGGRGGRF